jgi:hypothetical protein
MKTKEIRIAALFMAMLVVSMFAVTPAMACVPGGSGSDISAAGEAVKLTGEEEKKLIDVALENYNVKRLQQQLIDEGLTQTNSEAFTLLIDAEDGSQSEVRIVAIEFQDESTLETKNILYSYNAETGHSTTAVILGALSDCVFNMLACLGTAVICLTVCAALTLPDPATPLQVAACLGCIPLSIGVCGLAYTACDEYYNG